MRALTVIFVLTIIGLPSLGTAEPVGLESDCVGEIRRCLEQSNADAGRDICLASLREQRSCAASKLRPLLEHRFALSPQSLAAAGDGDAFFGTPPFDTACVSNCDRRWLGMAIQGSAVDSMQTTVDACLSTCEERLPLELLTP